jgi:hypothetical protein
MALPAPRLLHRSYPLRIVPIRSAPKALAPTCPSQWNNSSHPGSPSPP